jgi:hypothetical protein
MQSTSFYREFKQNCIDKSLENAVMFSKETADAIPLMGFVFSERGE